MSGRDLQHALQIELGVELRGVPDDALPHQQSEQGDRNEFQAVPAQEGFAKRRLRGAAFLLHAAEPGRLVEPHPDPQREAEQPRGNDERNAPGPAAERVFAEQGTTRKDHGERKQQPERGGGLYPAGRGAAIFAADGEALDEPGRHRRIGRGDADRGVDTDHVESSPISVMARECGPTSCHLETAGHRATLFSAGAERTSSGCPAFAGHDGVYLIQIGLNPL
ncbi:MAG TPA: hypothetical protein VHX61_00120 [Rhizomicrobium sp.]|nr:hypothetical protein [Rhizomicrobium sp.]